MESHNYTIYNIIRRNARIYSDRTALIKAFIVLKSGIKPSDSLAQEIQGSVKQRLSKHSWEIEFLSELPKTASGKIMRRELRKRL